MNRGLTFTRGEVVEGFCRDEKSESPLSVVMFEALMKLGSEILRTYTVALLSECMRSRGISDEWIASYDTLVYDRDWKVCAR